MREIVKSIFETRSCSRRISTPHSSVTPHSGLQESDTEHSRYGVAWCAAVAAAAAA